MCFEFLIEVHSTDKNHEITKRCSDLYFYHLILTNSIIPRIVFEMKIMCAYISTDEQKPLIASAVRDLFLFTPH